MKICFVCSEYPPGPHGGIGSLVQTLARALASRGHQVRVVGVYEFAYPAPDYEEDEGVQVWRLREPRHKFGWVRARWRLFRQLSEWSQRHEIELVEVPDYQGWAAGWPRLPVPVIVRLSGAHTFVSSEQGLPVSSTARWVEKATLRRADFLSSVSRYVGERIQAAFSLPSGTDSIIYNPVPIPDKLDTQERDPYRVVFGGTLNVNKGILSLIEAWPQVKTRHATAHLHVHGKDWRCDDGVMMRDHIKRRYPPETLESIVFHGMVTRQELAEAFRSASVAVFPSKVEAFGLAPAEAMAWGCPTIYTRSACGPEVIDHDKDGLLINPDSVTEIAGAINRLLDDRAFAARLGAAGRQKVLERFSLPVLIPQNEAFFASAVEQFKSRQALFQPS
jgi:glycosyltransferase involved in cell wall biosynthesis